MKEQIFIWICRLVLTVAGVEAASLATAQVLIAFCTRT